MKAAPTLGRRLNKTLLAVALILVSSACYGTGVTYVGVTGPAPWYGYPSPGMYPPGGAFVGVAICCEEEEEDVQDEDGAPEGSEDAPEASAPIDPAPEGSEDETPDPATPRS